MAAAAASDERRAATCQIVLAAARWNRPSGRTISTAAMTR